MAKITPRVKVDREVIKVQTQVSKNDNIRGAWWHAASKKEAANMLLGTAAFLKDQSQYRYRQAAIHSRLYGNIPLFGAAGSNLTKIGGGNQGLPIDRPTMSVITSCIDTLVSRITQSRPRPIFLTDNADYKQRSLSKQLNQFISGELYQTKAYGKGAIMLRDASVLGSGVLKVLRDQENRVALERRLATEILTDPYDALYGEPRQLYEVQLVDRSVLLEMFGKKEAMIMSAEKAYPDQSGEASKTVSDQIMVVEGWHLPSGPGAKDGQHMIACTEGILNDKDWKKKSFPFAFLHFSPRMLGFWGQGLSEQLMGTQTEINKLLITISRSINLVGVPRVFLEEASKVVSAHLNNEIGSIVKYRGTKPTYEVAPCVPQEVYAQLQRLVEYAYQQSGISALSAGSKKPQGLNSGAAIREYDDLQTDRFATLEKRYDQAYIDLTYLIIDEAKDIAEETGEYQTVFPNKDGTKQINLPEAKALDNPFVIQCFDSSSLPRDPAGRLQRITEMMQAGLIDVEQGKRLLDYPDIEQNQKLAMAAEERILKIMDEIVEEGKYTPPDPFMKLPKASEIVVQYYNLYAVTNLEPQKLELLQTFFNQVQALNTQANPPTPPGPAPQAVPNAPPQSDMIPNVPGAA